ncbi:ATP-binding protein [Prosthecobacter sp.]|uniref:sensor histidine kinase n=1 Tax=Prosthecobacter sp. TaxID=1965333 RepID=UPI001E0D19A9|nr:ATP-binding protein [Prosthecobacter sp.]MCB1277890.1 PAS domain-containing protein [Prosthecobacter sp.]
MTTLCIVLSLLLVISIFHHTRCELRWRERWEGVAKAIGMRARDASQLHAQASALFVARQEAEHQAEQRRVFETLLDEISQGLVLVDEHLRVRYANQPLKRLLHHAETRPGRALIEVVRDHQITDLVQEAITEKQPMTKRIQMLPSDVGAGTDLSGRHFLIESAPLAATSGGGAWLMIQDVTDAAMTEQIRRDFVANASHELRTPLTLINGYIEMLQEDAAKAPASMKRSLDVMEKHGKRIARIIEDMLAISRLEDAGSGLNKEPFDVQACAQDAADHLAPMLEGRDARIEYDFPEDGGQLIGDRFYWDQVFTNLIENSIKENNRPGLVIRVSGEWQDNTCILKVSDNGIGIPAHDLPFVFKRFYRGNKHHSSQIKGTGLGLSIVKRAVEAHGGTVELTSSPGIETVFTMRLPLQHTKA